MVSPELISHLLDLPEQDREDLAWRLLSNVRDESAIDQLDDDDRERLHQSLWRSEEDVRSGRTRPAADLLVELRERRR